MWLPLMRLLLGTWLATQACALTGNPTCDPLVRRLALNPLNHPSQGIPDLSKSSFLICQRVTILKGTYSFVAFAPYGGKTHTDKSINRITTISQTGSHRTLQESTSLSVCTVHNLQFQLYLSLSRKGTEEKANG